MSVKRFLIFGAGMMGRAIAYDLLNSDASCRVTLVDSNQRSLDDACASIPHNLAANRIRPILCDLAAASDPDLWELVDGHDVVTAAARYDLNVRLTKAAISLGAHFNDLGGNTATVEAQFALHDQAVTAGVSVLPDCGIAPGAVSVLTRFVIDRVPDAERVFIRVGGLPQNPKPPLEYALAFSAHGLVANYAEPCEVIVNGKLEIAPPLSGRERMRFPQLGVNGRLEAVLTSDGLATLAKTYAGRIPYLDYKTLRYEGHWDRIKTLHELGLFNDDLRLKAGAGEISPREFMAEFLNATLEHGVPDLLVLRVGALRSSSGREERTGLVLDLVDKKNLVLNHSAMQRTTGYSASICAQMLASGEIKKLGVLKHEVDVPPERFIEEWKARGIVLTESDRLP